MADPVAPEPHHGCSRCGTGCRSGRPPTRAASRPWPHTASASTPCRFAPRRRARRSIRRCSIRASWPPTAVPFRGTAAIPAAAHPPTPLPVAPAARPGGLPALRAPGAAPPGVPARPGTAVPRAVAPGAPAPAVGAAPRRGASGRPAPTAGTRAASHRRVTAAAAGGSSGGSTPPLPRCRTRGPPRPMRRPMRRRREPSRRDRSRTASCGRNRRVPSHMRRHARSPRSAPRPPPAPPHPHPPAPHRPAPDGHREPLTAGLDPLTRERASRPGDRCGTVMLTVRRSFMPCGRQPAIRSSMRPAGLEIPGRGRPLNSSDRSDRPSAERITGRASTASPRPGAGWCGCSCRRWPGC